MCLKPLTPLCLLALLCPPEAPSGEPARPDMEKVERQIVERTNEFRKGESLEPVGRDDTLDAAAREFARFMARTGKYGHEADGRKPAERVEARGYDYCLVLENIAMQFDSRGFRTEELASAFVTGWKESPGHRKNMLDPDVTETGVGLARAESGRYYAVQLFARPKSQAIRFEVVNRAGREVEYRFAGQTYTLPERVTRTHTVCRPGKLALTAEGGSHEPANGDRYAVVEKGGDALALVKERAWPPGRPLPSG